MTARAPSPRLVGLRPDAWTQPFWSAAAEHRLVCARCGGCGTFRMPPSPFCHACRSQEVDWVQLGGEGRVYSYTVIRRAVVPMLRDSVPYVVAVVELPDAPGVRLVTNIVDVDPDEVHIGMPVAVGWDDVAEGVAIPRFRSAGR